MSLAGKIAVVLGASAKGGIGWAIAEALAADGATLVVGARSIDPLRQLARQIGGCAVQCDATRPDDIEHLARTTLAEHGRLDIAVNAAGDTAVGLISEIDPAIVQQSLDINYIAHFHFVRAMAQAMEHGGSITLMSSNLAVQPVPNRFAYGCAKAATDCLVRHAAMEYGPRGIRVNSIQPGPVWTDMAANLLSMPGVEETMVKQMPVGRIAAPADIANIVRWLSLEPGYLTGLNLPASGGMHLTQPPRTDRIMAVSP